MDSALYRSRCCNTVCVKGTSMRGRHLSRPFASPHPLCFLLDSTSLSQHAGRYHLWPCHKGFLTCGRKSLPRTVNSPVAQTDGEWLRLIREAIASCPQNVVVRLLQIRLLVTSSPSANVRSSSKRQSKHTVDRLNPQPARLRRCLTSKFSGGRSSILRPGRITAG